MYRSLVFGLISTFSIASNAAVITESESFSPVLVVDGSSATTSLTVSNTGLATDVNVWVDFSKCDLMNSAGDCTRFGSSFLSEIVFSLTNPFGDIVQLVNSGNYSGNTNVDHIVATFDDDAATGVSGTPVTGSFQPFGLLADFNGLSILGDWTLTFRDTVGLDPLSVNAWGLEITTAEAESVPEPASIALLGLGLAGMSLARKKKTA